MTLVVKIDGVALPDGALVIGDAPNSSLPGGVQGLPLAAYYGQALTGGYSIDDPNGEYDFTGLHTITAEETAAANPFITGGWITGRSVHRGIYKSGVSRVWQVDFIDINWLFALMVFRAGTAHRPAETDIARMAYIQSSAPMAFTPAHDNGRFNVTDNPVAFDDADLVGRYPIEAINEFVGIAGKNAYVYWDPDEDEISIHYDLIGVGPTAALTISNDIADTTSTCFYPFVDAELVMDSAYKVTGILFNYKGSYAYNIRQETIDELGPTIFSPSGLQRDEVYRTDRVGKLETAQALIASMLVQRAIDTDTIAVTIRVPAAKVNDALPGEIITVKFTHLPGYEEETDLPIIRRNVVPTPGRTDSYDLHLELSGAALPTGPGGGGGGNPFPQTPPCVAGTIEVVQSKMGTQSGLTPLTITFDSTPTAGNLLYLFATLREVGTVQSITSGWTQSPLGIDTIVNDDEQSVVTYYKVSDGTETNVVINWIENNFKRGTFLEIAGVAELSDSAADSTINSLIADGGTVTPDTGAYAIVVTGFGYNTGGDTNPFPEADPTLGGGATGLLFNKFAGQHPVTGVGYQIIEPWAGGSIQHTLTFSGFAPNGDESGLGQTMVFLCSGGDAPTCPDTGQPNARPEVVTLTGADGTTACPFADGTLHVFIDATEQTANLVSQDGITGDFTLGFDPTPTEVCTVEYLGR